MKKLRSQIRNTEIDGLSDTLVRLFKDDPEAQTDAFLVSTIDQIEDLSASITSAIMQDKIHSKMEEADDVRDEAIKNFGKILSAYAVFPINSKKELALPLKAIFEKYENANITSANYTSKSSLIESLLADFSSNELAHQIASLEGVSESIAQIRNAQDLFTKANDDYIKAHANKGASASSYNKPILSLINEKLIPYLDAMVIANQAHCLNFAKGVQAEITRMNNTILKRMKKADPEETDETEPEAED